MRALVALILVISAQSSTAAANEPGPAYEVASIKPSKPDAGPGSIRPGFRGRLVAESASLASLIQWAWQLEPWRLIGASGWIASEKYDIQAKAPERAGLYKPDEILHMMRGLLEDRFKVKVRAAEKEMPVYFLDVAKGGPKLTQATGQNCFTATLTSRPEDARGLPPCGGFFGQLGHIHGYKNAISAIAAQLGYILKSPVADRTGLKGDYDVELQWTPFDRVPGTAPDTLPDGPSIFTAVQEQLGLKLESGKAPVPVIVMEHAERPSPN